MIIADGAILFLALLALWLIPQMIDRLKTAAVSELAEINLREAELTGIEKAIEAARKENRLLNAELAQYGNKIIGKDDFLASLTAITKVTGAEVRNFSQITEAETREGKAMEGESQELPRLTSEKFRLTLYGSNAAIYESIGKIKELSPNHRIRDIELISDYAAKIMPKLSKTTTMLEALGNSKFIETNKLTGLEFTEAAAASFTIEYFYRPETGGVK